MIKNPIGVLSLCKREIVRFLSVASQTIFPPVMTSALFMYVFGVAIGSRIDLGSNDLNYLEFIIPGLMCMHLISSAYENTSASLFIARWHNHIQEVLLSPLSYFEMVLGLLVGGVCRGLLVTMCVYGISLCFYPTIIQHPWLLIYFMVTISVIFACAGMMSALWAEDFNMLNVWHIYVILPLIFLGGVFHPMAILPEKVQVLSAFNPLYYVVNGMRFSVSGTSDAPLYLCVLISLVMATGFFSINVYLFKIGYKLRT